MQSRTRSRASQYGQRLTPYGQRLTTYSTGGYARQSTVQKVRVLPPFWYFVRVCMYAQCIAHMGLTHLLLVSLTVISTSLGIAAYSCDLDSKSGVETGRSKSPLRTSGLRTITPSACRILEKLSSSAVAGDDCGGGGDDEEGGWMRYIAVCTRGGAYVTVREGGRCISCARREIEREGGRDGDKECCRAFGVRGHIG